MRSAGPRPRHRSIFGDLDFRSGDDFRSADSPAAYLADLLRFIESPAEGETGEGDGADRFPARRPGTRNVPLGTTNTCAEPPLPNGDRRLTPHDGKPPATTGLGLTGAGSAWIFPVEGNRGFHAMCP